MSHVALSRNSAILVNECRLISIGSTSLTAMSRAARMDPSTYTSAGADNGPSYGSKDEGGSVTLE